MRETKIIFIIFILTLSAIFVSAEEVPIGMEELDIGGGHHRIVPKGSKVEKRGNLLVVESTARYVGRRFYELEHYIRRIEADQQERIAQLQGDQEELIEQLRADQKEYLKKLQLDQEELIRQFQAGREELIKQLQVDQKERMEQLQAAQEKSIEEIKLLKSLVEGSTEERGLEAE